MRTISKCQRFLSRNYDAPHETIPSIPENNLQAESESASKKKKKVNLRTGMVIAIQSEIQVYVLGPVVVDIVII